MRYDLYLDLCDETHQIGIMAYGSLIDDPGDWISTHTGERIAFETPFPVEYDRLSNSRKGAHTVIPIENGGTKVPSQILILTYEARLDEAMNALYQMETRGIGTYIHRKNPSVNTVQVLQYVDHPRIEMILYTHIGSNIDIPVTAEYLAEKAIESARKCQGDNDGISYLHNHIMHGIVTPLTKDYTNFILRLTNSNSLLEARNNCRNM